MQYEIRAEAIRSRSESDFETLALSPNIDLEREWRFPSLVKLIKEVIEDYDLSSTEYYNAKIEIRAALTDERPEVELLNAMLHFEASKQDVVYRALAICHFAEGGDVNAQQFISRNIYRTVQRGFIDSRERAGSSDYDDLISVPLLAALRKIEALDPLGFRPRLGEIFGRSEPPFEGEAMRSFFRRHHDATAASTLDSLQIHLHHSRRWGTFWSLGPLTYFFGLRTSV